MIRDERVTITKSIGIILMVLAHSGFSQFGDAIINMFHMPLFFFMSGYCFKEKYLDDFMAFFLKKIKGVYWPYLKWSVVFLLLHNVFFHLGLYKNEYTLSMSGFRLFHIVFSMALHDQLLGGYWFLHSLFWGSVFAYLTTRSTKKIGVLGGAFPLVLCFVMKIIDKTVPIFAIGSEDMLAAFFIFSGYWYKKKELKLRLRSIIVIPIGIILVIVGAIYWRSCVPILEIWKVVPYCISAISGTLAIFFLSKIIMATKTNYLFVFIGDNTLQILTWHFLCFKIISLIIVCKHSLSYEDCMSQFPVLYSYTERGWWFLYFFAGLMIPLSMVYLRKRITIRKRE